MANDHGRWWNPDGVEAPHSTGRLQENSPPSTATGAYAAQFVAEKPRFPSDAAASAPPASASFPSTQPAPQRPTVASSPSHSGASSDAIASRTERFAGQILDGFIALVTLGIGWIILSLYFAGDGQTVGRKIMGTRVIDRHDNGVPSAGRMFLRDQIVTGPLVPIGAMLISSWAVGQELLEVGFFVAMFQVVYQVFQVADGLAIFGDGQNRTIKDRLFGTVVIKDSSRG